MTFVPYAARTQEKMQEVLMDPSASGPAIHYYMVRGGSKKRNVTILETGTVGGEYIKTYGHYHIGQLDETYWFSHGEGVVLQQKLADSSKPDVVEEFKAIRVKAGDSVYMPPGYGHLMVNVGSEWLVMVDDSPVEGSGDSASMPGHADYELVREMHGFAYYVVEKDDAPALVPNPHYKEVHATDFGGILVVDH
ncbi:MAG TPA: glucose-6-phosphate isomerase family protein [Candidatus Paceibacterota bacterium]|nr:glucose-6-phosphate isomerase family protein [Candidatus Paceibacterota bacterium]